MMRRKPPECSCPSCNKSEFIIQTIAHQGSGPDLVAVGGVVTCFHCRAPYGVLHGKNVSVGWLADVQRKEATLRAEQQRVLDEIKASAKTRPFDSDMKWPE